MQWGLLGVMLCLVLLDWVGVVDWRQWGGIYLWKRLEDVVGVGGSI